MAGSKEMQTNGAQELTAAVWTQFVDENGEKLTELFSLRNPRLRPASTKAHSTLVEYEVRAWAAVAPTKNRPGLCAAICCCICVRAAAWLHRLVVQSAPGGLQLIAGDNSPFCSLSQAGAAQRGEAVDVKDNDVWCVSMQTCLFTQPCDTQRALAAHKATREVVVLRSQVARRGDHRGA